MTTATLPTRTRLIGGACHSDLSSLYERSEKIRKQIADLGESIRRQRDATRQ